MSSAVPGDAPAVSAICGGTKIRITLGDDAGSPIQAQWEPCTKNCSTEGRADKHRAEMHVESRRTAACGFETLTATKCKRNENGSKCLLPVIQAHQRRE